jgi:hypothetical protein
MDISQEFLIDLALNVGGYLLAGVLSVVLYTFVNRKKAAVEATEPTTAEPVATTTETVEPPSEKRRVEFIQLGEKTTETARPNPQPPMEESSTTVGRRDRTEIIRIARNMLKAGASNDRIKSVLPISESELALMDMSKS